MDLQSVDVETAKQASMAEEESGSPLMKKPKVEEEEDKEEENEGGSDSDGNYVLCNHLWFKHVPEKEPEWDVDSYDGLEYKSDPEDRKIFSDEDEYQEYRRDKREMFNAKGFIPDYVKGIYCFGDLEHSAGENWTNRDELTRLASLCVKKLNEDKGKSVKVESIVRATVSGGARWKVYITFKAKEYENGPVVDYQAKVMRPYKLPPESC
ncbi:hypothetical protein V5N11_030711 [Cardamine amara subsp. amara]|uniref:Cystatin domain-containing protein n=1 Tax=Cardamine amara subsp. amara TaxID=228776 RepID=A0ABD0ZLA2_CARAN